MKKAKQQTFVEFLRVNESIDLPLGNNNELFYVYRILSLFSVNFIKGYQMSSSLESPVGR